MELQFEPRFNILSKLQKHSEVYIVGILVAFYLFFSNYYYWSATFTYGGGITALPTSGGSDPYYNFVAILHILVYHSQLIFDPTLNYPLGTTNPRNPFFHWFIVLCAEILSPFMGTEQAAFYAFEEFDAVFGALLIIPVYLVTREVFGKNTAAISALLYTLMPSNLSAGILSGGRMHTPELIFAFFAIYFFAKAIKLSQKGRIIENLKDFKHYHVKVLEFFNANRIPTIYALLAGASLGGLMLSWQGYAYIEAILLIYVAVQLIVNLFLKRPTGYVTFYTTLFIVLGFAMGGYYYIALGEANGWYNAEVMIGVVIILFGLIIGAIGRRPWILIVPLLVIAVIVAFEGMSYLSPALLNRLLSGEGYFIKTRVYATIAEAAAPQLGSYIGGFGVAQFMLGFTGIAYAVYLYFKEKTEVLLFILVFSVVSIYMSFAAARFNITAAPAYAILGAAMLSFFAKISRLEEIKKKKPSASASPLKSIRGNIKGLQVVFVVLITALLLIPSATFMVSASVPYGSPAQAQIEQQIGNSIPSFLKSNNTTNFVGGLSAAVSNGSTPLSKSFAWLSTQDSNVPIIDKPAYVSWWDYGFQQRYQAQHPTVADDFQQGIAIAGQTLLAQNNTQIVSLFIGRLLQGSFSNGNFTANVTNSLNQYLGASGYSTILNVSKNPNQYKETVLNNPSIYGQYIPQINTENVYFAFIKGYLASNYSASTVVNLYQSIMSDTGNSIKYIQIPTDNSVPTMLPTSAQNTGIFYAPAYLTYTPSYSTSAGGVIPTAYYNIYANTANGTYSLQNLPPGLIPTAYNIQYTQAFYNTSIYRFTVGLPPSAVGQSFGIPGLDYGSTQYTAMPAWNMSNFELVYENIPYNPYTNYQAHPNAWTTVPLQEAYTLNKEHKGTVELLPPVSTLLALSDPIVAYYAGAIIHGQVTMPGGSPVPGVHVTIFDQYGVPHQVATTNAQGYYNITALPGNDTLYYSMGTLDTHYMVGTTTLGSKNVYISDNQANRVATSYNTTTGLPDYYIQQDFSMKGTSTSGYASYQYQQHYYGQNTTAPLVSLSQINTGTITYSNSEYGLNYSTQLVDGNYSFSNLPPVSYEVTLTTNGHTYKDFQYANITNGGSLVYDVAVPFDTIFANLSLAGNRVPDLSVSASGTGYVAGTSVSNSTGTAEVWVTPGNYTVRIDGNNITSLTSSVSFTNWNQNETLNMTPVLSSTVSIGIMGNSGPANVTLYRNGLLDSPYALTYSNGRFTGDIPFGIYTVYALSSSGAFLRTISVNGSYFSNITLEPIANLTLTSNMQSATHFSGQYEILNSTSFLQYSFTNHRTLKLQMPEGAFTLAGIGIYTGGSHSGFQTATLFGNSNYNLSLTGNGTLSSLTFNSGQYSSYNAQSAISSGVVVLKYGQTPIYYSTVSSQGLSRLYYPSYANDLTLSFENAYYLPTSVKVTGTQTSIAATPVTSQFLVQLNQTVFSSPTQNLRIVSVEGSFNYTLASGAGTVDAPVGLYYVSLSATNSLLVPNPHYMTVNKQNIGTYYLGVSEYSNVTSSTAQIIKLFYSNGTEVSNNSMVLTGTYQYYAYSYSQGVAIGNSFIQGNTSLNPTFKTSDFLTLKNSQGYTSGTYTISNGANTFKIGGGVIALPSGTYAVSYKYAFSNSTGSFTFTGQTSINLAGNYTLNLTLNGQENYTALSGYAFFGTGPSQNAKVMLVNAQGSILNSTNTNSAGFYSINVPSGDYSVYAVNAMSKSAYFGTISISGFAASMTKNLTMVNGYYVTTSVNLGSSIVNNLVKITSDGAQFAFYSENGSMLLPTGTYTFLSSTTSTEQTMTGSTLTVTYSAAQIVQLNTDITLPLTLNKNVVHSFQAKLISPIVSISKGENVSYKFNLTNTGNSNETVFLPASVGTWSISFNQGTISLMPGQSVNVTMNATLTDNIASGSERIPFKVDYVGGSVDLSLPVNVNVQYNYTVGQDGFPIYQGNNILIPVLLNNTGNSAITINLSLNQTVLKQNGWYGSTVYDGNNASSVTLAFGSSKVVYITLNATVQQPVFPFSFTLHTVSTNQNKTTTQNALLSFASPQSAKLSPYPSGNDIIANYTGSPVESLLSGVIVIAAAVVGGLILTAYRSRKK